MKKIDWYGKLYWFNLIILITTGLMNFNNISTCIETAGYHVWICDTSFLFWITHISFIIWFVWSFFIGCKYIGLDFGDVK